MKVNTILPIAAAGLLINHKADCQDSYPKHITVEGVVAKGGSNANETLYGPLKVIEFPGGQHSARFVPYPDIDPEVRKSINNGGLDIMCSSCNATGCICPDKIDGISDFCEFCRGTKDGGIRCYCSPALSAAPCNTIHDHTFGCDDQRELCSKAPSVYFCEPQPWYQDPKLADMELSAIVYDFKVLQISKEANITQWAEQGMPYESVIGAGNYTRLDDGTVVWKYPGHSKGSASRTVLVSGVAAAAVAAAAAFLLSP